MTGKQLKNSILQLAIQGKLVPQDPHDEPASELLKRIRKEKEQLVKEGKLKKKDLESTPIAEDEKPFEIPESWEWCRWGELAFNIQYGYNAPALPSGDIRMVRISDIQNSEVRWNTVPFCNIKDDEISSYLLGDNDILFARTGGTVGKSFLVKKVPYPSIYAGYLIRTQYDSKLLVPEYLKMFMDSDIYWRQLKDGTIATAQPNCNGKTLSKMVLPIPPLSEQHRIVEKIEELMPLVEEFDKAQSELDKLNESLPEQLKKSILQQAIIGKLVPQDPNDEPASELLKRINIEKENLVKSGALKKKDLITTPISDDEKPFDIPESWEWVRLGEVGLFERGNGIKRDETFDAGLPCVRYGEMYTRYRYSSTFDKTVSFTSKDVFDKCRKAHKGDLFMALTGENKEDIALAAQYVGDEEIAVGGDLCHFTILEAFALYFVYLINSPYYKEQKRVLATGDIIVHISADKLGSVPIPLPPLFEQHRIVAKIEELFSILK